jgi:hypothetical protein
LFETMVSKAHVTFLSLWIWMEAEGFRLLDL